MSEAVADWLATTPEERRRAVADVIQGAHTRLALGLFRCNDPAVIGNIGAAVDRGVRVEVIVNARSRGWKREAGGLPGLLCRLGALVHRYPWPNRPYHAKFLVADDGPALVGSLNLTAGAFERTCDFAVLTHDDEVVRALWRLFRVDCEGGVFDAADGEGRLVVGPEHARERISALVEDARFSLRILDHKLRDQAVWALLHARRADGVRVEVCTKPSVLPYRAHGRVVLVDDRVALVGGMALSSPALDSRRELGIIVRDPVILSRLDAFLRWAGNGDGDAPARRGWDDVPCELD